MTRGTGNFDSKKLRMVRRSQVNLKERHQQVQRNLRGVCMFS